MKINVDNINNIKKEMQKFNKKYPLANMNIDKLLDGLLKASFDKIEDFMEVYKDSFQDVIDCFKKNYQNGVKFAEEDFANLREDFDNTLQVAFTESYEAEAKRQNILIKDKFGDLDMNSQYKDICETCLDDSQFTLFDEVSRKAMMKTKDGEGAKKIYTAANDSTLILDFYLNNAGLIKKNEAYLEKHENIMKVTKFSYKKAGTNTDIISTDAKLYVKMEKEFDKYRAWNTKIKERNDKIAIENKKIQEQNKVIKENKGKELPYLEYEQYYEVPPCPKPIDIIEGETPLNLKSYDNAIKSYESKFAVRGELFASFSKSIRNMSSKIDPELLESCINTSIATYTVAKTKYDELGFFGRWFTFKGYYLRNACQTIEDRLTKFNNKLPKEDRINVKETLEGRVEEFKEIGVPHLKTSMNDIFKEYSIDEAALDKAPKGNEEAMDKVVAEFKFKETSLGEDNEIVSNSNENNIENSKEEDIDIKL